MTVTLDHQIEFNGLLMGADTPYQIISQQGFGLPEIRTADLARYDTDGVVAGRDRKDARRVILELLVIGATASNLWQLLKALRDAAIVGNASYPLDFQLPYEGRNRLQARCRRLEFAEQKGPLAMRVLVEFVAPDPTWVPV